MIFVAATLLVRKGVREENAAYGESERGAIVVCQAKEQ
mgnify:CR=1 FL=1